ncbi:haloacid dehalogenase type II [Pseudooceanicola sp. C21-150M6]|uniref:haloacid dehalogenase type II n=1 Tax=Pseudooceanicola sp. C21-150M6 TaxID=3434355 RepID=UPI003D7F54AA
MTIRAGDTLAFDVYGTLIDTQCLVPLLTGVGARDAISLSALWRELQLEFSFRRALMQDYQPFTTITRQALRTAWARSEGAEIPVPAEEALLAAYLTLAAFDEVPQALTDIGTTGVSTAAFSNGDPADLDHLLHANGLAGSLGQVISVAPVKTFKPDPRVYAHFLAQSGTTADRTWLVSGNPFDILGAARSGWRTIWVQRDANRPFDDWGAAPTITVSCLREICAHIV